MGTLMFINKESLDGIANKIRGVLGNNAPLSLPDGMISGVEDCYKKGKDDVLRTNFTTYDYKNDSLQYNGNYRDYAFAGNTELTSVTLYDAVVLPRYCFYKCTSLEEIVSENTQGNEGYTKVYNDAVFKDCSSLESVKLSGATDIGNEAFSGCTSLESVVFPANGNSVTAIGNKSFLDDSALTEFTFSSYLRTIGEDAFRNTGLTSLNINSTYNTNGLTIGSGAFCGCTDLTMVSIAANNGITIGANCFDGDTSLTTVTLPSNITRIPDYCFNDCSAITRIVIPASVRSIGAYAFAGCSSLEEVVFTGTPSLTTIETRAFYNCSSLTSMVVPESVTRIDAYAFSNCDSMEYIRLLPTVPPTAGSYIFYNTINNPLTIYVPDSVNDTVFEAYQSATNWKISSYKSHMAVWPES
ncbi:MAG: leucine-rich repeat domain-containing protein [Bacteroidales bacterium]|nr:leucine-rich repeat domain-containing protein [Bacteroidales bacterium]